MKKYCVLSAPLVLLAMLAAPTFAQNATPQTGTRERTATAAPTSAASTEGHAARDTSKSKPPDEMIIGEGQEATTGPASQGKAKASTSPAGTARQALTQTQGPAPTQPNQTPSFVNSSSSVEPFGEAQLRKDLDEVKKSYVSKDDLGPLSWLSSWMVVGPLLLLLFLALALHLLHLLKGAQTSRDIGQLEMMQQKMASGNRAPMPPGQKNIVVDKLAEQLTQQGQGLSQFTTRLNQLENRLTLSSTQVSDAVNAVALTASWIGQSQLREAGAADGGGLGETERASLVAMLERYREPLRLNAVRVEPLAQALAELVEKLEGRASLSPELMGRVQTLYQDIGRFDQWHREASNQLASLQRGSFSQRSSMLQADQQRLIEEVHSGSLSIAQMVQKSRALLEQYFPDGAAKNGGEPLPSIEQEPELKKTVAGAPEYLMDWFDNLFQLQGLVSAGAQGARAGVDADIIGDLAQVQKVAREVLGKFDIQPEAIQVGQTSYDRRLHEATMVRQSSQFPINTVIEVHRCGFRKMSTGEVLRRPQVVVASATTA